MSSTHNQTNTEGSSSARVDALLAELNTIINTQESQIAQLRQQQNLELFSKERCAEVLLEAREAQNLTLERLSLLSGVSTVTLTKLEKGQLNVNFETLIKVFDALGISVWIGQ